MSDYNDLWYMEIESKVYNRIVANSSPYLTTKYPDIIFTTSADRIPSQFPCVEIRELPGVEQGQVLDNVEVVSYMSTFQATVFSEKDKTTARDVMAEVSKAFKAEQFNIVAMPLGTKQDNLYVFTARFRRLIASGDSIAL